MSVADLRKKFLNGLAHGAGMFSAVAILSLAYAATTYYPDLPTVSSGSTISAAAWNDLANYANKSVKQETEVLTITGGKVGIGTTGPTSDYFGASGGFLALAGTSNAAIKFERTLATTQKWEIGVTTNGNFDFTDTKNNPALPRIRIDTTGNVGIGTMNPTRALHVYSTTNNPIIQVESWNAANDPALVLRTPNSHQWSIGLTDSTNKLAIGDSYAGARMVIDTAGNVGIGTVNPTGKLDVNGPIVIHSSVTNSFTGKIQMEDDLFHIVTPTWKQWEFRDNGTLWFYNGTSWIQKF